MLLIIKALLRIISFLEVRILKVGFYMYLYTHTYSYAGMYIKAQENLFMEKCRKTFTMGVLSVASLVLNMKSKIDHAKYTAVCLRSQAHCILYSGSVLQFPYCFQNRYSEEHAVNSVKVKTLLSRAQGKAITEAKA